MSLTEQLKAYADQSAQKIPAEAQVIMKKAIDDLSDSDILKNAHKTGDILPDISLPNAKGDTIHLKEELKKGTLVIVFYRGGWCPYCNIELKALQAALPKIKMKGAQLIAITPETPDNSLSTQEKNELSFEVLTDNNNAVARSLGLVYQLPDELNDLYLQFGINLENSQGNSKHELPIAATYVVNQNGEITYHFLQEDYKLRADPEKILEAL